MLPSRAPRICATTMLAMRVYLRYTLRVGQIALASALFGWTASWRPVGGDAYGASPAPILPFSINLPVAQLRGFWFNLRYGAAIPAAILIVLSGILWYWGARNIAFWRQENTVLMFRWLPPRIVGR